MKELDSLTEQNFNITYECIGKVINNVDTLNRGRLQVRIYGIIDDSIQDVDCPWCEVKGSLISSYPETIGLSSAPKIGTLVYINFLYHNPSHPIVTGYVRGNEDSSVLHSVTGINDVVQARTEIGPELTSLSSSAVNPNNTVIETKSYTIELDDTKGNERVSIQHLTGSYIEIRPNGDIQTKSSNNEYTIIKGNLEDYIEGSVNRVVKQNITQLVEGNVQETTNGNETKLVKGSLTETINIDETRTIDGNTNKTVGGNIKDTITGTINETSSSKTVTASTTTFVGDVIVTGDVIIGGNSIASDHLSSGISGNSHTHTTIALGSPTTSPN